MSTFWVDASVGSSGDGLTKATAKKTIAEGITLATNTAGTSHTIYIVAGSYSGTYIDISIASNRSFTITSETGDKNVTFTASGAQGISLDAGGSTFIGLTVVANSASNGVIKNICPSGTVLVSNCTLSSSANVSGILNSYTNSSCNLTLDSTAVATSGNGLYFTQSNSGVVTLQNGTTVSGVRGLNVASGKTVASISVDATSSISGTTYGIDISGTVTSMACAGSIGGVSAAVNVSGTCTLSLTGSGSITGTSSGIETGSDSTFTLTKAAGASITGTAANAIRLLGTYALTLTGNGSAGGLISGATGLLTDNSSTTYGAGTITMTNQKIAATAGASVTVRRKCSSFTATDCIWTSAGISYPGVKLGEDVSDGVDIAVDQRNGTLNITGLVATHSGTGHGFEFGRGAGAGTVKGVFVVTGCDYGMVCKCDSIDFSWSALYSEGTITGWYLAGATNCALNHCTIVNAANGSALVLSSSQLAGSKAQDNTIKNCIIEEIGTGYCVYANDTTTSADNIFDSNCYYKVGAGDVFRMNSTTYATLGHAGQAGTWLDMWDTLYNGQVFGGNDYSSVVGNPLLVSPSTGDFSWTSGSAARRASDTPTAQGSRDIGYWQKTITPSILGSGMGTML